MGNGEGSQDRLPYWCLARKFQTGWLNLHFWEKLKLQLGHVLKLGVVSWAFNPSDAILGLWFFFFNKMYDVWAFISTVALSTIKR